MIELKNLHKYFNRGRENEIHVINDITLTLPDKGMVAVFGKSGCGKTTLLNVIGGLDSFAAGTLTVEGQSIREDTDTLRNRYIGYVFQNYNLDKGVSCYENVASALRLCGMTDEAEIRARVLAALANVGMEKYEKRPPDTLSGGQQQRIAIARAIVKNPRIVLADEPTGNLDEANTVMIMDLLRAIARDHLVVLVTHEENLVDHYCDTVIELSDGAVVNVRHNDSAEGLSVRDKNDIYLGELPRTDFKTDGVAVAYYGELPKSPLSLKIVNHGGKLYCQFEGAEVHALDGSAEVKLREGVFEEKGSVNRGSEAIDMSKLPPVSGSKYGRLFHFKSSVRSGFYANFKKSKRSRRALIACMCLFAAAIVVMSAVFGTAFRTLIEADRAYNHNVFYVHTPDGATSERLHAALADPASGIDGISYVQQHYSGDNSVWLGSGMFESFYADIYQTGMQTHAVYLPHGLAAGLQVVAGRADSLADDELLITTAVADELLAASTLGYVSEYSDLLGMVLLSYSYASQEGNARVVGVVSSSETAVYLSEMTIANIFSRLGSHYYARAGAYGYSLSEGQAVLAIGSRNAAKQYPAVGGTLQVNGMTLQVTEVLEQHDTYAKWLAAKGYALLDEEAYYRALLAQSHPTLDPQSAEYLALLSKMSDEHKYEYMDYYYAYVDAYLQEFSFFHPEEILLYLYTEKGYTDAKFDYIKNGEEYYAAQRYRALYGKYPTAAELAPVKQQYIDAYVSAYKQQVRLYEDEFYREGYLYFDEYLILLSDADFIAADKRVGETSDFSTDVNKFDNSRYLYTVLHASDPDKATAYLAANFADLADPSSYQRAIVTPRDIYDSIMEENLFSVIAGIVTMAVVLAAGLGMTSPR